MDLGFKNIEQVKTKSPLARIAETTPKSINLNSPLDKVYNKGYEVREFGIDKCKEVAKEIFTPKIISQWPYLPMEQKANMTQTYADGVSKAFNLKIYQGVVFDHLKPNELGYNNGNGIIHLNQNLLTDPNCSILKVIDTVTHELRHQYQVECISGYHNISPEVVKEWSIGIKEYTINPPYAYDPWGYKYNPVEIDARFAAESVVREMTKDYINGKLG